MCIVHAGFRGIRTFVARKKSWCNLTSFGFLNSHDTIHLPLLVIKKTVNNDKTDI